MFGHNFSKNCKVTLVKAGQADGTSAINSDSVDMQNFRGVAFFGSIATQAAGNFGNAAQSSDDSSFDDLLGTKVIPGDSGDSFMIDVYEPLDRYVRCEVARGTSTVTGDIYAVQYGARKVPVTHGATIDAETHISPAEGTA
jgi:hypothetical protein